MEREIEIDRDPFVTTLLCYAQQKIAANSCCWKKGRHGTGMNERGRESAAGRTCGKREDRRVPRESTRPK
jgi:hypothetical protein